MSNQLGSLLDASLAVLNSGLEEFALTARDDIVDPPRLTRQRRLLEGACLAIVLRAALQDHWGGKAASLDDSHRDLEELLPGSFVAFCLKECSEAGLMLERLLAVASETQLRLTDVAALREFLHSLDIVRAGPIWQLDPGEDARKRLGAFYTPVALARAITRQSVDLWRRTAGDAEVPSIADASVGAGEFLLAALEEFASVSPSTDRWHLAKRAVGLDVDPLATELTMLRVAN